MPNVSNSVGLLRFTFDALILYLLLSISFNIYTRITQFVTT